mgnify:CR=1 FL=1
MVVIAYPANINRLVEGWDTAFVGYCSHKLKILLSATMNLRLAVLFEEFYYSFLASCYCDLSMKYWYMQMTKMKAILEQENWNEIDVPEEYQNIVTSLFSSELLVSGDTDDPPVDIATRNGEMGTNGDSSNSTQNVDRIDSVGSSGDSVVQPLPAQNNIIENDTSVAQSSDARHRERGRSSCRSLLFKGLAYHTVNW